MKKFCCILFSQAAFQDIIYLIIDPCASTIFTLGYGEFRFIFSSLFLGNIYKTSSSTLSIPRSYKNINIFVNPKLAFLVPVLRDDIYCLI
jgi:hypothetical protein